MIYKKTKVFSIKRIASHADARAEGKSKMFTLTKVKVTFPFKVLEKIEFFLFFQFINKIW